MQEIITYAIIACAIVYASTIVYRTIKKKSNPCDGCAGCDIKQQIMQNRKKIGNSSCQYNKNLKKNLDN